MTAGVPGIALSGLFYILCALAMPLVELVRTARGTSSLARWVVVGRQVGLAGFMLGGISLAFRVVLLLLPARPAPRPSGLSGAAVAALPFDGSWAFIVTVGVMVGCLLATELAGFLVPRLPGRMPRAPEADAERAAAVAASQSA